MTLTEGKAGQWLVVTDTGAGDVTWQALRFGIESGSEIQIQKVIPGGPVIVAKNQLEIAIGRQIAQSIQVQPKGEHEGR